MCDGEVRLARAQRAIARDWETAQTRLGLGSGPAPAPQPQPTHAAGKLRCAASVSTTSPADYHPVYVYVRTAPGASVTTVAHYKTTDNQKTAVADGAGRATIAYYISGATPGYAVRSASRRRQALGRRRVPPHSPRCPDEAATARHSIHLNFAAFRWRL